MNVLDGKVAVVTGGASGMGEAIAKMFLESGARVVIGDLSQEKVQSVAKTLAGRASNVCVGVEADVSRAEDVERLVRTAQDQFGGLDIMCNNAGYAPDALLHEMREETFERTMDVNLKGTWLGIKYGGLAMMKRGGGAIITIASFSGLNPRASHGAYGPSKAGAIMVTRIAALEYAKYGIRCNVINPGAILTPMVYANPAFPVDPAIMAKVLSTMQPLQRTGEPIDIAQAALWLSSDASRFVTGQVIGVDGGGVIFDSSPLPELVAKAKAGN